MVFVSIIFFVIVFIFYICFKCFIRFDLRYNRFMEMISMMISDDAEG